MLVLTNPMLKNKLISEKSEMVSDLEWNVPYNISVDEVENVNNYYFINMCVVHKINEINNHFQSYKVLNNKTKNFYIFSTKLHEFLHAIRPKFY